MSDESSRATAYYNYFEHQPSQIGGALPVFIGSRRYQYGSGFGDVLRGLFKRILPVALKGAAVFLGETARSREEGASIGEAVKAALKPAASFVFTEAAEAYRRKQEEDAAKKAAAAAQEGSGLVRTRVYKGVKKRSKVHRRSNAKKATKRVKISAKDNTEFYNF